jgi:hypothetical protein
LLTAGLFNLTLVTMVGMVWLMPMVSSLLRTQDVVRLQESRLALYQRHERAYEDTAVLLAQWDAGVGLVPYEGLADALAEITRVGLNLGLGERTLSATEPVGYDGFYILYASAVYEGQVDALVAFALTLGSGMAHVQRVQLDFNYNDTATMRLGFSLLGHIAD